MSPRESLLCQSDPEDFQTYNERFLERWILVTQAGISIILTPTDQWVAVASSLFTFSMLLTWHWDRHNQELVSLDFHIPQELVVCVGLHLTCLIPDHRQDKFYLLLPSQLLVNLSPLFLIQHRSSFSLSIFPGLVNDSSSNSVSVPLSLEPIIATDSSFEGW